MMSSVIEKAAYYVTQLYSGEISSQDEIEFEQWLAEDKQHIYEYQRMLKTWDTLGELPSVLDKNTETGRLTNPVSYLFAAFKTYKLATVAVSIFLFIMSFVLFSLFSEEKKSLLNRYQTLVGEQKRIVLSDGSVVTLNTNTLLETDFRDGKRKIKLEYGEAFFDIAKVANSSMMIDLGNHKITVLGTQFSVYRSVSEIKVAVVEGRVSVNEVTGKDTTKLSISQSATSDTRSSYSDKSNKKVLLVAGNALNFSTKTKKSNLVTKADIEKITDWRDGLVRFDDQPLSQVISELNRYSLRKVLIQDKEVMSLSVSGTFRFNDIRAILEDLNSALPITIIPYSDRYVILKESI